MGQTLLHHAVKKNDHKMCKLLIESDPNGDEINQFLDIDEARAPKWKSDPNKQDNFGRSSLFIAV